MNVFPAARAAASLAWLLPAVALASPPAPIDPALHSFPGAHTDAPSAASAGVALTDRWLADEPFWNPAIGRASLVVLSPLVGRVNRQDLRADNRHFDEQAAFFDAGGAWAAFPWRSTTLSVYAFQPVLRLEENAFERGSLSSPTPPGVIQSTVAERELRAGAGWAFGGARARAGAAAEWTRRSERFEYDEQSGSPQSGLTVSDFSGSGWGAQAGGLVAFGGREGGAFQVGASARYLPELTLKGEQTLDLTFAGSSRAAISVRRGSAIEGGLSVRWKVTEALALGAAGGVRTEQEWKEFGIVNGAGSSVAASLRYHDPLEAWTVRFGLGREQSEDVPEPRADVLGLGIGWKLDSMTLDFGVLRRSFVRNRHATSFDDRLVVSAGFDL